MEELRSAEEALQSAHGNAESKYEARLGEQAAALERMGGQLRSIKERSRAKLIDMLQGLSIEGAFHAWRADSKLYAMEGHVNMQMEVFEEERKRLNKVSEDKLEQQDRGRGGSPREVSEMVCVSLGWFSIGGRSRVRP